MSVIIIGSILICVIALIACIATFAALTAHRRTETPWRDVKIHVVANVEGVVYLQGPHLAGDTVFVESPKQTFVFDGVSWIDVAGFKVQ